jgi:organic radical activating enzyme
MSVEGIPIHEEFLSIQGEGAYVGTPMYFIRTAGCNVGRPAKALKLDPFPVLPNTNVEASACTSWDGRTFPCDTDYSPKYAKRVDQLVSSVRDSGYLHALITGGEPLIHKDVPKLVRALITGGVKPHIETSGTLFRELPGAYVSVSPKISSLEDMITRADELKLLIDDEFDISKLTERMYKHPNVFLCPINSIEHVNNKNVQTCFKLLKMFPQWRVSVQLHKFFNWR